MSAAVKNIGIVGGGAIGTALGGEFTLGGASVNYWDIDQEKSSVDSLESLAKEAEVIVLCIPSWANQEVAAQLATIVGKGSGKLVVSVAKGVAPGFVFIPDVLEQASKSAYDTGIMYGPMLAQEIANGKYGSAVLATKNSTWHNRLQLKDSKFYIEYCSDTDGVALCGVLKNIYAIGFGIVEGLGMGENAKGRMTVLVLDEMKQLFKHFRQDEQLIYGLAGLGDLLATGLSDLSFNHRIGKALAEGILDNKVKGEGANSLFELAKVLDINQYKIANQLHNVLESKAPANSLGGLLV